ncbi:hypothetical protein EYF80_060426 [Liparis tanakae]|uniref:Uncharacterized protein n=1 Tax=Liparis tanakae TaxID=230148 RepID=A0A4Z2EKZ8_9TELE|nr:hypothetical protein EYF80_060426 [Liparis tanakae]
MHIHPVSVHLLLASKDPIIIIIIIIIIIVVIAIMHRTGYPGFQAQQALCSEAEYQEGFSLSG